MEAVWKESERLWRKGFVKEMSFKSGVKVWVHIGFRDKVGVSVS